MVVGVDGAHEHRVGDRARDPVLILSVEHRDGDLASAGVGDDGERTGHRRLDRQRGRRVTRDRHHRDAAAEGERPGGRDADAQSGERSGPHTGDDVRDAVGSPLPEHIAHQVADHLGVTKGVGGTGLGTARPVRVDEGDGGAKGRVDGEDHPSRVVVTPPVTPGTSAPARVSPAAPARGSPGLRG